MQDRAHADLPTGAYYIVCDRGKTHNGKDSPALFRTEQDEAREENPREFTQT